MSEFWTRIADTFDPGALGDSVAAFIPGLLLGIITFLFYYLLWVGVRRLMPYVARRSKMDETTALFVKTALKFIILTLGVFSALDKVGFDTTSLLASLGIVGLTVGFAARDALSNLISGVLIFWDRPFHIGDLVEVEGQYGRVESITMRSTRVVTPDGRMLAVPNTTVINSTVASYTNFPHLRLDIAITVGVNEDLGRVRQILLDLVGADADFMKQPAPTVVVTALNDYNVAIELRAWLEDETQHVAKRVALREAAFEALRSANVDLPFETIQLAPVEVKQVA